MRCLVLACLVACSSSSPPPPSSPPPSNTPPPGPPVSSTGPAPSVDISNLGQPCKADGTCTAPAECVAYYGIAGPRGPKFTSCEIRCSEKSVCPAGTQCTTVADGPGAVCRAPHP